MIYLLEDDASIRELVIYGLESQKYEAVGFERPSEFWGAMAVKQPELILLDIMLPEEDGLSILKRLRAMEHTRRIPVIMLTAKKTEYDRVIGLDNGADDFISKPFGILELVARVRAVLRRAEPAEKPRECQLGELVVSPERHQVTVAGADVVLTSKEFSILWALIEQPGVVVTRQQLMERVWGYDSDRESRTLDVHIRSLRSKLGRAGRMIETIRCVGYKIEDKP
ncbi:MAG: response regulator transcription factor [Oscillospiraceae bacterium]|nr:response regulator transcription factor [Oscillospiraceae bacterium]